MDTTNVCIVRATNAPDGVEKVVIVNGPKLVACIRFTKEEALNLAAWLVATADPCGKDVEQAGT